MEAWTRMNRMKQMTCGVFLVNVGLAPLDLETRSFRDEETGSVELGLSRSRILGFSRPVGSATKKLFDNGLARI
jgi:hypothetical protein